MPFGLRLSGLMRPVPPQLGHLIGGASSSLSPMVADRRIGGSVVSLVPPKGEGRNRKDGSEQHLPRAAALLTPPPRRLPPQIPAARRATHPTARHRRRPRPRALNDCRAQTPDRPR